MLEGYGFKVISVGGGLSDTLEYSLTSDQVAKISSKGKIDVMLQNIKQELSFSIEPKLKRKGRKNFIVITEKPLERRIAQLEGRTAGKKTPVQALEVGLDGTILIEAFMPDNWSQLGYDPIDDSANHGGTGWEPSGFSKNHMTTKFRSPVASRATLSLMVAMSKDFDGQIEPRDLPKANRLALIATLFGGKIPMGNEFDFSNTVISVHTN
jgi:hypothetical protein